MRVGRFAIVGLLLLIATSALGQTSPNPAAGATDCPPDVPNGPTLGSNPSGQSLSERLDRSKGVICPPAGIDTDMSAPPPGGGRTPVIRPPGSPGGDQSVQPK
jgi:hypothetical protein